MAVVIGVHFRVGEDQGAAHAQLDADDAVAGCLSLVACFVGNNVNVADEGELFAQAVDGGDFAAGEEAVGCRLWWCGW